MVDASTMPRVAHLPERPEGRAAPRVDRLTWRERLATQTIWRPGRKLPRYKALAERFLDTKRPTLAIDLLLGAPHSVRRRAITLNLLLRACAQANDQVNALAVLKAAQADHPQHTGILVELSNIYRNAAQFDRAREALLAAEALGSDQSTGRAIIETAMRQFADGYQSLRRVTAIRGTGLLQAAPLVDETSVHYLELAADVAAFRAAVRSAVRFDSASHSPAERIRAALHCRMVDEAQLVHESVVARGLPLDDRIRRLYAVVREQVEPLGDLARCAWDNEHGDAWRASALVDGRSTRIDATSCDPRHVVELFIPRAFYRATDSLIVRGAFLAMAAHLSRRPGTVIVPRHQFNLRNCRPMLPGRVISFHTRGGDDKRHLRYKDGALADHVTVDHRGYAGFASIATDFDEIRRTVVGVSADDLRQNQAALHAELVRNGRSKYPQPADTARFNRRYVFVALQKVDDEVAELVSMSSLELLRHVAQLFKGTGTTVVTKRHPYCKSYVVQAGMQELAKQGLIVTSTASIHSLLSKPEVVFTANSGVGLEALVHGRPVVVSGAAEYAYAAARVRNPAGLSDAIAEAKQMAQRGLEFLYFYTHRYAFTASDTPRLERRIDEWLDQPLPVP